MRRRAGAGILLLVAAVGMAGCGREVPRGTPAAGARDTAVAPATALAADMCPEHGVLEAICTRCHPHLIPVFQARGDWCAEHGFPLSVCPVHHPERGGRPMVAVGGDDAPATGTRVRFTSLAAARDAGIETVAAVAGPQGPGVHATATLVADAAHVAVVNARAPGVVNEIRADLGGRVARGAPLAVLESSSVGEERSRLRAARAREASAAANLRREQDLHDKGISALREVEEARREWEASRAEVAAATAALAMVGDAEGEAGSYVLRAPIAGVVTRRAATVGTLVGADEALFEIVDTARLWADIDVPERDVGRVREGQAVVLQVEGLPGREFRGTVRSVAPVIDPLTRTARARAALANPQRVLRANMYAKARIETGADEATVLVPATALQDAYGVQLVFVRLAADTYEARRVRATPTADGRVAIAADVRPGERVVTTGGFLLKTETLKESIGAGCCEVEPPRN